MVTRKTLQLLIGSSKEELIRKYPFIADVRLSRNAVDILVAHTHAHSIPYDVLLHLSSATASLLPVNIITNVQPANIQLSSGDGITSASFPAFDGTAGCLMIDGRTGIKYILTCAHVYSKGRFAGCKGTITNGSRVITSAGKKLIGVWEYALISKNFDMGLISLNNGVPFDLSYLDTILGSRDVTDADVTGATAVTMHGYASGNASGIIVHRGAQATLKYADGTYTLQNLIAVAKQPGGTYGTISKGGDSGSLLTDSQYILGMVIGGNAQFTYAVPMTSILKYLGLTIYKPSTA